MIGTQLIFINFDIINLINLLHYLKSQPSKFDGAVFFPKPPSNLTNLNINSPTMTPPNIFNFLAAQMFA